ncbi:serine/arginine repetitive matrix protein 2 [Scaptodrosophila lebanonensis]|uniref:Serine/arginine repetitive matrix protein 2 n=1 Tax=Drosophila lebanonensis TaxID=7225 RepID=A0A6J2T988_DROLE|nr:serine/arginine repetitive matrix protein 2 [Scaptodrosophila lebanonensis]
MSQQSDAEVAVVIAATVATADAATKLTSSAVDELQDGENSLESGEVITPPHLRDSSPVVGRLQSPLLKKVLSKDVKSKSLRKHLEIDDNSFDALSNTIAGHKAEGEREIGSATPQPLENGNMCAEQSEEDKAAMLAKSNKEEDSEGLYSDTDSSTDDQKNLEDVQKARLEKKAEQAAALTSVPPPPYLTINPMRFHMRHNCFNFPRMPRMPRGGMRGNRPPFFGRPPSVMLTNRPSTPVKTGPAQPASTSQSPLDRAPQSSPCTYGPALPPNGSKRKPTPARGGRNKPKQSDVMWTTAHPPVSYVFNIVSECINKHHKECMHKSKHTHSTRVTKKATKSKESPKETLRDRSKEPHVDRSKEPHGERPKELHEHRSKEQHRNRSKESHEERSKERRQRSAHESEKSSKKSKSKSENLKNGSESRVKTPPPSVSQPISKASTPVGRVSTPVSMLSTSISKASTPVSKVSPPQTPPPQAPPSQTPPPQTPPRQTPTPQTPPPPQASSTLTPPYTNRELRLTPPLELAKGFDIFAESPPRLTKPALTPKESKVRKEPSVSEFAKEEISKSECIGHVSEKTKVHSAMASETKAKSERSTTPPLSELYHGPAIKNDTKTAPLIKASEIYSRIDALLQDNDDLETLLATQEWLRKTHEHRGKKMTPIAGEKEAMQIKQTKKVGHDNTDREMIHIKLEPMDIKSPKSRQDRTPGIADKSSRYQREHKEMVSAIVLNSQSTSLERHHQASKTSHHKNSTSNKSSSHREDKAAAQDNNKHLGKNNSHIDDRYARSRSREHKNNSHDHRQGNEYKERAIKLEKKRFNTPPRITEPTPEFNVLNIKVEREDTPSPKKTKPPTVNMRATPPAKIQPSPDTDDYIDNWENDDSQTADGSTPQLSAPTAQMNGLNKFKRNEVNDDDDDDVASYSNRLWNAKSTPPPKSRPHTAVPVPDQGEQVPAKQLISIHELYDKFMNSIKMSSTEEEVPVTSESTEKPHMTVKSVESPNTSGNSSSEVSKNSSLSNSTAEEESSSTESTSSSGTSTSEDDDNDEEDDESEDSSADEEQTSLNEQPIYKKGKVHKDTETTTKTVEEEEMTSNPLAPPSRHNTPKKNNVSKDLRKLKSLEDNLARIQMMRETFDSADDICNELLQMEKLFLAQKNAIVDKYRNRDLKLSEQKPKLDRDLQQQKQTPLPSLPLSPANNIFAANREAIKLTISPLKLTRKSAILDKDDSESAPIKQQQSQRPPTSAERSFGEKQMKPAKEIAIVKPTIMDTKSKRSSPPKSTHRRTRERSLSRSHSRARTRRSSQSRQRQIRNKTSSRSQSPRRWRGHSPRLGNRSRLIKRRTRSRSVSRSRSRSRSPFRRRRIKFSGGRRRSSLSPMAPMPKTMGPRSPPMRRRSYSRERYSRSPLPFRPPSPPMRRSWSSSRSRSPPRRHARTRSRSPYADYFEGSNSMDAAAASAAAAYYYNMSLLHGAGNTAAEDVTGENYESYESYAAYAAYMDTYNMSLNSEDGYAQYMEYSNITPMEPAFYPEYADPATMESGALPTSVLRELPKVSVAVQKGNVLEIVPSAELNVVAEPSNETVNRADAATAATVAPDETESKPKRKRVNFVDKVQPNNESDNEDRTIVQKAVESAIKKLRERRALPMKIREELLALPPPPPPAMPCPPHLEKAICVRKKPKMRFFHFDPFRSTIVRTQGRMFRPPPRFDPKYMAMLMKSGRFPMPPFNFHALHRHRPPLPLHAARAALLKDNLVRMPSRPPPPRSPDNKAGAPPLFANFLHLPPPRFVTGMPPAAMPQPIPVVGQSYHPHPRMPAPAIAAAPTTNIVVPLIPPSLNMSGNFGPPPISVPYGAAVPPPLPPLPPLQSHFTVKPISAMKEIMPVDILQKIGPLPKTLDLDVNPSADEATAEPIESEKSTLVSVVSASADNASNLEVKLENNTCQQQQLVESL